LVLDLDLELVLDTFSGHFLCALSLDTFFAHFLRSTNNNDNNATNKTATPSSAGFRQ
jgi:hypothetical protein